jgi:hypothetical protein
MELEKIARDYEGKVVPNEKTADKLERQAEQLFRLASRVRRGE